MIRAVPRTPEGGTEGGGLPEHWQYGAEFVEMAAAARFGLDPFGGWDRYTPPQRAAMLAFERVCIRTGVLGYGGGG